MANVLSAFTAFNRTLFLRSLGSMLPMEGRIKQLGVRYHLFKRGADSLHFPPYWVAGELNSILILFTRWTRWRDPVRSKELR